MSREEKGTSKKQYYMVFDGTFRTKVDQDHPEAKARINKNDKQVFEKEVRALFGFIQNVYFEPSDYGEQLKIELDENEEGKIPVLSFGVESKDGRDVLRKLPGIDFTKEVRIMPYRFSPEDKEIAGISITQQDEAEKFTIKIENFFFDKAEKKYLYEFPIIDWDNASTSEQKIYKIKRDEYLVNYTKNNIIPKFQDAQWVKKNAVPHIPKTAADTGVEYPKNDLPPITEF